MKPLAEKLRPRNLSEFAGQQQIIGPKTALRKIIEDDSFSSLIFWGPPGTGKTTLARIIAEKTKAKFVSLSATEAGVADLRREIKNADKRTILFIDEIHRFNKAQQDRLLPYVENGTITLIGATTENPSFGIIAPLLSRSLIYRFQSLKPEEIKSILQRAIKELKIKIDKKGLETIVAYCDGDARSALNALEFCYQSLGSKLSEKEIQQALKNHSLRYDKKGEEHYNVISAFIKSMRDSDPNGALYWLARMIESGEDPRFIARRMVIFASEDIGNADFRALLIATATAQAVEYVGMPEAQINLAQATTYLSTAKKSNASYKALLEALKDAQKGSFGVPLHLRNAVTSLMEKDGYGKGYRYAHDESVENQKHFPKQIQEKKYYRP